jgi:hypothetical protein
MPVDRLFVSIRTHMQGAFCVHSDTCSYVRLRLCRRMILSRLAWSERPSSFAV